MTIRHKEVDAVTIGVGWAGGILAAELTKAGFSVVGLERGRPRGVQDWQNVHDELRFAVDHALMQDTALETWTLRHSLRERALPLRQLGSFLPGTGLGGAGIHWNGQTYRFHPRDFIMRTSTLQRYGAKALPPDSSIQDWGITYQELEPYYDKFEYMAGIAGKAGNLKGDVVAGGNPFEGPRSREYPVPPAKLAETTTIFGDACSKLGYHPFPQPSANLPQAYTNPDGVARAACTYCGFCERFGCEVGAKADPTVTVLPVAMRSGKFELRTGANVLGIDHDGRRATGVTYLDGKGQEHVQPAKVVLVTAFVFNNCRLLLLSKMGRPYDPASGQGVVGRNYSYQVVQGCYAFFDDRSFKRYMGSGANAVVIDDFNADNFDHKDLGFIGGGSIYCQNTGARPIQQTQVPKGTPKWGAAWKAALAKYYDKQMEVVFQGESPAYRQHALDLDPTYRDALGQPLIRITFDFQENERKMVRYGAAKIDEILKATGATHVDAPKELADHYSTVKYQTTHTVGGCVVGADPATSVVNNYCQMWDFDNVFVVGGSAFPQNAGFNPTCTIGALAYRAADGIVNRYMKRPGPLV